MILEKWYYCANLSKNNGTNSYIAIISAFVLVDFSRFFLNSDIG
jgi:hypothetical protein